MRGQKEAIPSGWSVLCFRNKAGPQGLHGSLGVEARAFPTEGSIPSFPLTLSPGITLHHPYPLSNQKSECLLLLCIQSPRPSGVTVCWALQGLSLPLSLWETITWSAPAVVCYTPPGFSLPAEVTTVCSVAPQLEAPFPLGAPQETILSGPQ